MLITSISPLFIDKTEDRLVPVVLSRRVQCSIEHGRIVQCTSDLVYNCSKQSACAMSLVEKAVACSILSDQKKSGKKVSLLQWGLIKLGGHMFKNI